MTTLGKIRLALWGAVAVAGLVAGVLAFGPSRQQVAETVAVRPAIGGPFKLVDGEGRTVRDADLHGKPFAIFFGFTHCPDICPTALYEMTGWIEALGADAERLRFVFVTIDPERDTPEIMQAYVRSFTDDILPLTGTPEQVASVLQAYRVYARKVPLEGGDYTMDHSTMVYLMDGEGQYVSHVGHGETQERAVEALRALLRS
jgi:protein SCO1